METCHPEQVRRPVTAEAKQDAKAPTLLEWHGMPPVGTSAVYGASRCLRCDAGVHPTRSSD